MDFLPAAGLITAIILLVWLLSSLYKFGARGFDTFDAAIIPKYPSAMQTEYMNSATVNSYPVYPRLPPGTTMTNW